MTTKSVALSILGVSTVGGIATGGYFFMQPTNIGEILQSKGTRLLNINGNEKEWAIIAAKHAGTNVIVTPTSGDPITVKPISELNNITTKPDKGVADLKQKCQELFKKPKNDTDEENAKNWCTLDSPLLKDSPKPPSKSLREILASKNPLNTKDTTDNASWGKLVEKYLNSQTTEEQKIKVTGIKTPTTDHNNDANMTILKEACEKLLEKTENYENDKTIAENWCTKQSPFLVDSAGSRPFP